MLANKIKGGIYGVATGDALGATVEFMSKEAIANKYGKHTEIIGGGWLDLFPGEFTDDTQMTLAVAEGIIADPENPLNEIGSRFIEWYNSSPKDIGNIISLALSYYLRTGDWKRAASMTRIELHGKVAGNGCLMRTLPISFAYLNDLSRMDSVSRQVATMTHLDIEAELSCVFYNRYAACLVESEDKLSSFYKVFDDLDEQFRVPEAEKLYSLLKSLPSLQEENLKPSGYVVDTLLLALSNFLKHDSFEEILVETVNLGGDADTTGAVVGGLAGTYYGFDAIPHRWVERLMEKVRLDNAVNGLLKLIS